MRRLLAVAIALLSVAIGTAHAAPIDNGTVITFCDAEADVGICEISGVDVEMAVRGRGWLTFTSEDSTSTTYSCDIEASVLGTSWFKINTGTEITETQKIVTIAGPFGWIRINCTANSGGTVAVTIKALSEH